MISGNMVGMYSTIGKSLTFEDADGNQLTGVIVGQEAIFTATDDDVAAGKVYASDGGVSVGTRELPPYIYALVDEAGLCLEVRGTSKNCDGVEGYVTISKYNSHYIDKYYNVNNGLWYLEASFATEWIPE